MGVAVPERDLGFVSVVLRRGTITEFKLLLVQNQRLHPSMAKPSMSGGVVGPELLLLPEPWLATSIVLNPKLLDHVLQNLDTYFPGQTVDYSSLLVAACQGGAVDVGRYLMNHGCDPLKPSRNETLACVGFKQCGTLRLMLASEKPKKDDDSEGDQSKGDTSCTLQRPTLEVPIALALLQPWTTEVVGTLLGALSQRPTP